MNPRAQRISLPLRLRVPSAFGLLLAIAGVAACGRPAPPVAVAPPQLAACLVFQLKAPPKSEPSPSDDPGAQAAVDAAVEAELFNAGFGVTRDGDVPHDAVIALAATPGSRIETGARLRATLEVSRGGSIGGDPLDRLEASAPRESPTAAADVARELVDALFTSRKLAAFTKSLRRSDSKQRMVMSCHRAPTPADQAAIAPALIAPAAPVAVAAPAEPDAPPPPPPGSAALTAGAPRPDAFALILGVERYKSGPAAAGARADAQAFERLARQTLGVPAQNVKRALDERADKVGVDLTLQWLKLHVGPKSRLYVYFSGLGTSVRGAPYLALHDTVPVSARETALHLETFLNALSQLKARETVVFVDTSFAAAGPRSALPAGQPPPGQIKDVEVPPRTALFSAVTGAEVAGLGLQAAGDATGLMTHHLLNGLGRARADIDGDGRITAVELLSWMGPRVERDARRAKRAQTPSFNPGPGARGLVIADGLPQEY